MTSAPRFLRFENLRSVFLFDRSPTPLSGLNIRRTMPLTLRGRMIGTAQAGAVPVPDTPLFRFGCCSMHAELDPPHVRFADMSGRDLAPKTPAAAAASLHRAEAFLTLRALRARHPIVLELIESARLLEAAALSIPHAGAALGLP